VQRLGEDVRLVIHFTRNWIHYGSMAFVVLLVLVAAARGLAAR